MPAQPVSAAHSSAHAKSFCMVESSVAGGPQWVREINVRVNRVVQVALVKALKNGFSRYVYLS